MRSGLLVLNKPAGLSSRDCVNRVQNAIGDRRIKIGHAGTLDPLATGVLLVAVGEATRLVQQLHDLDKFYSADFQFGKSSDTLDCEGVITEHSDVRAPTTDALLDACREWTGEAILQQPPRYSAIKIKGRRAYDLARQGKEFEPESRPVCIRSLQLTHFDYPDWSLEIHCGSGTYVRSIGRDVAASVGNVAIMTALVRTAIGPFQLASSCKLADLQSADQVESHLHSPLAGLPKWTRVEVDDQQVQALRHGQHVPLTASQRDRELSSTQCVAIDQHGQLVAMIEVTELVQARPVRVFQTMMATSQPSATSARQSPES